MLVSHPGKRTARGLATFLTAGLALLALSCGNGRKPVFPVKGRVVDGKDKPAAHALVFFHPEEEIETSALNPTGHVDDNGDFTLTTYDNGDGAPAGKYVITLIWRLPKNHPLESPGADLLGGRFANPKTSKLSFVVEKKADNMVPTIQVQPD